MTQHVLAALQEKIVSGAWPPGHRLDSQRELAEQFQVSRASLREAISSLEAFGLVSVEPGRGVFVTEPGATVPIAWPAQVDYTAEELYEARFLLEGAAAALAALTITPAALDELGRIVDAMQAALQAYDQAELDRLDFAFHAAIASAGQNRLLSALLAPHFSERDMSTTAIVDVALISTRVKEHRQIHAAIAARDARAAQRAMQRHVLRAAGRGRAALRPGLEALLA
ncbi:FadR/GntR family transcriptional regulator [Verticiella sediminum]